MHYKWPRIEREFVDVIPIKTINIWIVIRNNKCLTKCSQCATKTMPTHTTAIKMKSSKIPRSLIASYYPRLNKPILTHDHFVKQKIKHIFIRKTVTLFINRYNQITNVKHSQKVCAMSKFHVKTVKRKNKCKSVDFDWRFRD